MAVDVVSSTRLLLTLAASRYQAKKDLAWKWEGILTPHGTKLRDDAFESVNFRKYSIKINDGPNRWECSVTRLGKGHVERKAFFMKEEIGGSVFGGCSCWVPFTDGLPCHHMIAVVKSSRIEGLNPNNAMPFWWTTECWRSQYPADTEVSCNFDMAALRATPEDRAMRYCPPFVAARKAGRPKKDKRIKGVLEGKKKQKSKEPAQQEPLPKRSKGAGTRGGKGASGGRRKSAD